MKASEKRAARPRGSRGSATRPGPTLYEELDVQARYMRRVIGAAHDARQKVHVINPRCAQDNLTDRWPGSLDEQEQFVRDLDRLLARLVELPKSDLGRMRGIMTELFGENPTGAVFENYNRRIGESIASGRSMHLPGSGRVLAAVGAVPTRAIATPAHTFFGRPRECLD